MQKQRSPRVKIKHAPGVYYRELAAGQRRYEFMYRDSDGKQRFETVKQGGLEEAKAARADMLNRLRKGEPVRPTKQTFRDFADAWMADLPNRPRRRPRPRTLAHYQWCLDKYLYPENGPSLGPKMMHTITVDDVAALVRRMHEQGLSGWTIRGVLTPLSGILKAAVRKGLVPANPVEQLTDLERPEVDARDMQILDSDGIGKLLAHSGKYRPLFATAIFTGLRVSELLGLVWDDVDTKDEVIHVRKQLDKHGRERVEPKTRRAVRDVVMIEALAQVLREHKAAAPFTLPTDPVFAGATGAPLQRKVVREALNRTTTAAGLEHMRIHDLRHCYASLLIVGTKADPVHASRQLGHEKPSVTLDIYASMFDAARAHEQLRDDLEERFGGLLTVNNGVTAAGFNESQASPGTAEIRQIAGRRS